MQIIDTGSAMENTHKPKFASSPFQRRLSLFLHALLILIGVSILWLQSHYDPAAWRQQHAISSDPSQGKVDWPEELTPLSPIEQYNAERLSDKINGKAELYLSAGFKSLESRRFGLLSDKNRWMERYVYDMGGHENAFAVYSIQRRSDIRKIDLATRSYLSTNGLFLVHGPYYMEIIAAEATQQLQSKMKALASAFVASHPVEPHSLPVLELFVPDSNGPHTTKLIADSAFGIQSLDWVYTAIYRNEKDQATVYISRRSSASEAQKLATEFISYWNEYDAQVVPTPEQFKQVRAVTILDNYEIAAVQGNYLFGVHEATHLDFALALISRMQQTIAEVAK